MENELKNQILSKVEDLIKYVKDDPLYHEYLALSKKIEEHPMIPKLINDIKEDQKKAVRFEVLGDTKQVELYDEKIKAKLASLEDYPLYLDFIEVQTRLDNIFQTIKENIADNFDLKDN